MNKLIILLLFLYSCKPTEKELKKELSDKQNYKINDTITLEDNHLYYHINTHSGQQPIHSQYCKQKHY